MNAIAGLVRNAGLVLPLLKVDISLYAAPVATNLNLLISPYFRLFLSFFSKSQ